MIIIICDHQHLHHHCDPPFLKESRQIKGKEEEEEEREKDWYGGCNLTIEKGWWMEDLLSICFYH